MAERGQDTDGAESNGKDLFDLLEQRVEALVDRQREALARIDDLSRQLQERDHRVTELSGQVARLLEVRQEVLRRVEGLIARVDGLASQAATPSDAPAEPALTAPEATA